MKTFIILLLMLNFVQGKEVKENIITQKPKNTENIFLTKKERDNAEYLKTFFIERSEFHISNLSFMFSSTVKKALKKALEGYQGGNMDNVAKVDYLKKTKIGNLVIKRFVWLAKKVIRSENRYKTNGEKNGK